MTKLNENQIRFCECYVANGYKGTKAYQEAYAQENSKVSAVAAHKMLRDPRITEKIREIEGDYRVLGHKLGIDKKLILNNLKNLLLAKKQVFYNGEMVGTADDNAARNKALETLLKIFGDFAPEKSEMVIEESEVDFSKMTDEEKKEYKEKLLRSLNI
jgi:hypothetical protein